MASKFNAVLFGGLLGAAAALLLAPRTGEETRALVTGKVNEFLGRIEEEVGDADDFVSYATVEAVEDKASEVADEMKEKLEAARARIAEQVSKNMGDIQEVVKDKVTAAVEVAAEKAQGFASDLAERLTEELEEEAED